MFGSDSDGLSSADDNHGPNCFVRDRTSGTTTLVNRSSGPDGAPSGPWEECGGPMISADGNRVAFSTFASLDPHDTNGNADVYVRDLTTNATILVSRVGDAAGNGYSRVGSIDADGNLVAFTSNATSFSGRPNDLKSDVYVHDIGANTTTLLSRATGFAGALADGSSQDPSISEDGTRVAYAATTH